MQLNTQIITSADAFQALKEEWLALLNRSVTNYVFQSPQFQEAWWQTLGKKELRVVAVRTEQGQLVGLMPLFLNDENELCFVGCVNVSDYLDALIDPAYQTEVYQALESALKNQLQWQSLYLCSLPEESLTRNWIKKIFPTAIETQQDVSPFIALPKSWEEYLESIDRKQRHEIKRKMRRVSEVDHQFEVITSSAEATTALEEFIVLHKASSAEKHDFWDDNHLQFFTKLIPAIADAGWLKLFFLKIGDIRAAAMLVFDYNNQYLLYNSGFNPNEFNHLSTGNVLTAYTIQKAIEEQKTIYDFLRGSEQYKFRFGAVAKPVFDISVTASL